MTVLNQREHARLARELIAACGGLDEAVTPAEISKAVLSTYQNPHQTSTMSAAVIGRLEAYCGKPIYSGALFQAVRADLVEGCLRELACSLTEVASDLQRQVRAATADGRLSPRELDGIAAAERATEHALEQLQACRRSLEEHAARRVG